MNICLILGLLCLVYGLTVAIAGSADDQMDIWDIVRCIFPVVSCD